MSRRCFVCGKGPLFGNRVSHSHRKTRKKQAPNLHATHRIVNGRKIKVRLCTKCHKGWLTG
ncbi:TPA: 50S ribosomal protein L28 [bacterium]|nr:50S ribosomal protein L28 [bacterium]